MTTALIVVTSKVGRDTRSFFPGTIKHSAPHGELVGADEAAYFHSVHSGGKTTKYKFDVFGTLGVTPDGKDLSGTFFDWTIAPAAHPDKTFGTVLIEGDVQLPTFAHATPDSLITALRAADADSELQFTGGRGNDTLRGSYWNDQFDGEKGRDVMIGGYGDDRYTVDNRYDRVLEKASEGTDKVTTSVNYTLSRNVENLVGAGDHKLHLTGNGLANGIVGTIYNDTIKGMGGDDIFDPAAGNDVLYGGKGHDTFIFKGIPGPTDVDRIMDFNTKADIVWLSSHGFPALAYFNFTGPLPVEFFAANKDGLPQDGNDFIVYDTNGGQLYYDPDGNGGQVRTLLATFAHHPHLTAADFFVIG